MKYFISENKIRTYWIQKGTQLLLDLTLRCVYSIQGQFYRAFILSVKASIHFEWKLIENILNIFQIYLIQDLYMYGKTDS